MQAYFEDWMKLDWSPMLITMKTAVAATLAAFFFGILAARITVKAEPKQKAVIDGILTLPMVMPPTVTGFYPAYLKNNRPCQVLAYF
ncbi:MAG TPA: hypothetical protein VHO68_06790, partial [Bacteroidales bacterium]|nr:hypothetical protein [Bacteroidales bacterium]